MEAAQGHDPVLIKEVIGFLRPGAGEVAVDCTTGRGGHALEILKRILPDGTLLALDVDPKNLAFARGRLGEVGGGGHGGGGGERVRFFHANFAEVGDVVEAAGVGKVDVLLADLGVSTNQLMEADYGLSFSNEGALDMRLDPRIRLSAADLLAELPEEEIANLIYEYAEERFSRRIARKIVQTRTTEPIRSTEQLARLVRSVVPNPPHRKGPGRGGKIDPATRTFQALRMAVNAETESLAGLLEAIPGLMKPGGRAAVISFHSGEDRLVKQATRQWHADGLCELLTKKPVEPDAQEMTRNPRSRSAKLRAVRFAPPSA